MQRAHHVLQQEANGDQVEEDAYRARDPVMRLPIERPDGKSHYGISRTIRVFFDLITIRFLLKYMMRPLHFFGGIGMGGIGTGLLIALYMAVEKTLRHVNVMDAHGPL